MKRREKNKPVPGWAVLAVVLVTAATTAWAMTQTARGRGWTASSRHPFPPRDAAELTVPSFEVMGHLMAAKGPPILAGSVAPHADRGACTSCHNVVTTMGVMVPSISALAAMPHNYRGQCANCHQLTIAAKAPAPAGLPAGPGPLRPEREAGERPRGVGPTQF